MKGKMNKMQSVMERIREITPEEEAKPLLEAKSKVDPSVGIIVVKLEQIEPVRGDLGQEYEFYAARVLPLTNVKPHYHLRGSEPYRFSSGEGEMNIGVIIDNEVVWESKLVYPDDVIIIMGGEVHSFRNIGENPVDFLFACPACHLINNPEGDRYFTDKDNLKNGIPPWYPS